MDVQDAGSSVRYLIRDHDGKYPALFDAILADPGNHGPAQPRSAAADERDHGTLGT
jgi:hypothetical protein